MIVREKHKQPTSKRTLLQVSLMISIIMTIMLPTTVYIYIYILAGKVAPTKQGRKCDFVPQYLCASFRHAQWIRQVRRLQSYVHFVQTRTDPVGNTHALAVWGSIIRAKGFEPSFQQWWNVCRFRVHGAPAAIPVYPVEADIAHKIFESVALAARAFESDLKKSSRAYARLRRESNPNMIFKDIKTHASKGVDALFQPIEAKVAEVNSHDMSIVLEQSVAFRTDEPLLCNAQPLQPIHFEDDCLWVEDASGVCIGDSILQLSKVGTDEELFQAFAEAWRDKWGRHADVPPERWAAIIAFARDHLPPVPMNWLPMDADSLHDTIRQKKSATSHGLDGVTLCDLKSLPGSALSIFCDMFAWAEKSGEWPVQVISGRVTSLAKTDHPKTPMDFRPITVFGILYRCWGTFHSKRILACLDSALPTGLFGSRPQCFAGQIWSQVLWAIEEAQLHDMKLCGLLADLHKAFNMLPRLVVFEACAAVGVPLPILVAWAGALSHMPRRFQIRNSIGPAVFSTCGFPEGDALSCVAMMVVDMIFHAWFTQYMPLVQPISYVDDWQLLMCDHTYMQGACDALDRLVQELDLVLDRKKTHTWAVHAESRQVLREQGFTLSKACKNLGAHLQFTRQHTNNVQMERIASLAGLWPKLRLSSCCYYLKVRALKCAAWPKGLHAIAATTLSLNTFQSLRAGAMKGLREDHSGCNSLLHLGLVEDPMADPHFWSIMQTLRFCKDCGNPPVVKQVLADMANLGAGVHNSITATLLTRLQFLGWHIDAAGRVVDEFGTFSLFAVTCVELKLRMEWQWLQVVTGATSHRFAIEGLDRTWPQSTRQWLGTQNPSDQAL